MPQIDRDAVERLARLSRLSLSEEEMGVFSRDLDAIIGHARDLETADTDNVVSMIGAADAKNVMREDELPDGRLPVGKEIKDVKRAFPEERGGRLKVPKIL